jgi:gas vesicle protein
MNRLLSFLSGAVMGGLVGAAVAIILAPSSGEDLRLQMKDRAQQIQEEVKTAAVERRAELEQQLEVLRAPRKPS